MNGWINPQLPLSAIICKSQYYFLSLFIPAYQNNIRHFLYIQTGPTEIMFLSYHCWTPVKQCATGPTHKWRNQCPFGGISINESGDGQDQENKSFSCLFAYGLFQGTIFLQSLPGIYSIWPNNCLLFFFFFWI